MLEYILKRLRMLRSIVSSIYFNFHYLPLKQAVRLPILVYKPRFGPLKGRIRIEGPVRLGMIVLGTRRTGVYLDDGIMFENHGGECVFHGKATIGGGSAISVGKYGKLKIGDDVVCNVGIKLICCHQVTIENRVRFGWEVLLMDSGLHRLKNQDGTYCGTGVAPIHIGHDTWISTRCMVMPGAGTAPYTVVAGGSLLNRKIDESYVLVGGKPAVVKKRGVYRDMDDDDIDYAACQIPEM